MVKTELDTILNTFFHHQIALKMFHFQTKSFGGHKAADDYLSGFGDHFDTFMETAQGTWHTVTTKAVNIKVKTLTDNTIESYLDEYIAFLDSLEKLLGAGHADLLAIRDEMRAEAQKLKYLLRFK
jgi:hypothetical protein